jgi:thiamine kinase-like enzyme
MLAVLIIIIFCFVPTFHDSPLLLLLQDYEYASFNPVAYDIANHFCEMAADYHSANPHILDYSKYPDMDEQKRFVKTYLSISGKYEFNVWIDFLNLFARF